MCEPGIAVIIPNWNGERRLARLLPMLAGQTRPPEEVIVVDNGSADASIEVAEAAGARVIRLRENLGFARAVNEGLRGNGQEWVAVLNNDVAPAADWLERLVSACESRECWFAAPKLVDASDPKRLDGSYDEICRGGCAWRCGQGRVDGDAWNQARPIRFAPFTAALFRTELFDRVGFLDEGFESYLEDVDFGLRCALEGYSGIYVPSAVAAHEGSATLGKWHPDTVRRIARNQLLLIAKHYPPGWVLRYGWSVLVAQGLWGLIAARHGCGVAFCRGKAEGLKAAFGRRSKPATAAARIGPLLAESEEEIRRLQRLSGFDWYWRVYFALT